MTSLDALPVSFKDVFRRRRALVTGHTGFKGAWLSLWLRELGAEVTGFSLDPPTSPSFFEATGLAERLDHRIGDVREVSRVQALVEEIRPHFIFHLAAQSLVRLSFRHPRETFEINVMGTANLLEGVRRVAHPCVVLVVTSDKCYENRGQRQEFSEEDPLGGHDPYSASKAAAEHVAASFGRSFFPSGRFETHRVALATARAGNVLGGGDWGRDRIVPDIVRALSVGKVVKLRNPAAVRPWQFVLDALAGYLWLSRHLATDGAAWNGAWNFGPARRSATSVSTLTDRILELWPGGTWENAEEASSPPEADFLSLDCGKAARRLRWAPVCDLEQTLVDTVNWYRAALESQDMYLFSTHQIAEYTRRARQAAAIWAEPDEEGLDAPGPR